jgi:copper(I)-binding protein
MPPGRGMTAAYGELRNNGTDVLRLLAYDSDAFESVSLHRSFTENGVSRMQEQGIVEIAAGESLKLEPGGLHLMLMQATRETGAGDEIEIVVTTTSERYAFKLTVEAR